MNDRPLNTLLTVILLLATVASLFCGRGSGFSWPDASWQSQLILWELRIPRTLIAVITGAVLGLSGACLQGWLRNPLADPGVLGISASASLTTVAALYLGVGGVIWVAPLAGLLGAGLGFLTLIALTGRQQDILVLILAGAALNAFCAALTALFLNLAPNPFAVQDLLFWLMGSFENRSWQHIFILAVPVTLGILLLASSRRSLNLLSLGTETARSMGVDTQRLFRQVALGSSLAVGACVSVTGAIGFVGLVIPHLLRPLTGWEPARLLLPSALAGAALLVTADIVVRILPPGPELRVGVLTALLGGPFFLVLLVHLRRQGGKW